MKNLCVLCLLLILSYSCTKKTEFGRCVGVSKDGADSSLNYEANTKNLVLGVLFSETIVVPILVLTDYFYCPISEKDEPEIVYWYNKDEK